MEDLVDMQVTCQGGAAWYLWLNLIPLNSINLDPVAMQTDLE